MLNEIIKIGIADDHPIVRDGIADLIHAHSPVYRITIHAENGQDLINKIAVSDTPQICILDINMPVLNGYDTISALKVLYPKMKFLVLTAFDKEYSIVRMVKNGANGYLLKSCNLDDILNALSAIHTHGYYYSEIASEDLYDIVKQVKISDLTENEISVLKLLCSELTYDQIAEQLNMSIHTIYDHKKSLSKKLMLKTRSSLVLFAIQTGIIDL